MGTEKYAFFYDTDLVTTAKRIVIYTVLGLPFLFGLLIPKSSPYWMIMIGRTYLPPSLWGFYQYGLSKYILIKMGCCNQKQLKHDSELLVFMNHNAIKVKPQ